MKTTNKIILIIFAAAVTAYPYPYETLNKNFSRTKSDVFVRKITKPTLANLDFAAYNANPVRFDPQKFSPKKPAQKIGLKDLTFDGLLLDACASISQTPLTDVEKNTPMDFTPLMNRLWNVVKDNAFTALAGKINGNKWADPSIYMPYQEITSVYVHSSGDSSQLWVKIEFAPWVSFLAPEITDADKDGFKEIYGKLSPA
ncbi:MAG: hypothetical protein PHC61_03250, partial [Chitinivibrionales bacterium]|nr:hypothetical protein [Chitinivibrionales bacterium]